MPYLSEEGDSGGTGGFGLASAPGRAIAQDGGHPGDRDCMDTHVCNCPGGKTSGKLNSDGLSNWTPQNAAAAKELVLAFHNIFNWMEMSLVAQVQLSMKSTSMIVNPSKSDSDTYLHPLLEEVCTLLRDMLDEGAICPSQSPWCNMVVLVQKKDRSLCFYLDFHRLNAHTKKDLYPLLQIQEALESMAGTVHFSIMDFKSRFWQVKMAPKSQQYTTFTMRNLGFYEFTHMPSGSAMLP